MKTKNKWGGAQLESKLIEKRADQWCKDNGSDSASKVLEKKRMEKSKLELKRLKRRLYMREYRKRPYVKTKTHEYYITRLIKQCAYEREAV